MSRAALELYHDALLGHAVPVLSMLDREEHSPSHGCFDRTFWAWKFTDFPGARFQEGLCFLAYLHATPIPGSAYCGSEPLARWIAAGFDFWARIQRPAGDFDEAYPHEHSLAATAFTAFYLSEAWGFAGDALPDATRDRFRTALARAGDWLCRHDEHHGFLSNHLAAAAAALAHAHRITGEARFERRARHFVDKILAHQSEEGWYEEYGGADPGYQTHGSFYLERILELWGDADLAASLDRSYRFLAHFVHADGSVGGEYASRNTQTYYPAAFEMAASRSGAAAWIGEHMRPSVDSLAAAGLGTVDLYNRFPLLNNTVFAARAVAQGRRAAPPEPPPPAPATHHFPEAGLWVARRERYDLIVGLGKGGVVKLFDRAKGRLALSDCGYVGRLARGGVISSQWSEPERAVRFEENAVEVDGRFYQVSRPLMDPPRFLAFRAFTLTLGRLERVALWLKALLVRVLIHRKREVDLSFSRRIELRDGGIVLTDRLSGAAAVDVAELRRGDFFSTIHMGSSRYFLPHELTASAGEAVDVGSLRGGAELRRTASLD